MTSDPSTVLRFRACERHLHWALAIPFQLCYLTAVVLVVVYNPDPTRPLRQVFSWLHRASGLALAVLPLATILWHRRHVAHHVENVRRAWTWSVDDVKWLALVGPAMVTGLVALPRQGKFNAAEKINFAVLMVTYPLYIVTGFTIWFFGPAFMSWMIHLALALCATPLVLGHIFMATVNPDTRTGLSGMITGLVDRHWARHHYRLWYDEQFEPLPLEAAPPVEEPTVPEAASPDPSFAS